MPGRALYLFTLPEAVGGELELIRQMRPLWGPILVISNIILDKSSRDVGTGSLTSSSGTLFLQPRETCV